MQDYVIKTLETGYFKQQEGDNAEAERLYLSVLKSDSENLHALNLLGMLCVNTSRPDAAIDYISRALTIDFDNDQAHMNIGLAHIEKGQFRKAGKHFEKAIELNGDNPVTHNNMGNVLRAIDKPGDAIRSYERAINIAPDYAECWSNLGAALNETEQHEPALKAVAKALELEPGLVQAYCNRGDIRLAQARFNEALADYERASELDPRYSVAIINMAKAQRDLDRPEEALATLDRVIEMEPQNADAHHSRGILLEQMGLRERAAESFKAAIAVEPGRTYSHYQLAQIKNRMTTEDEFASMQRLWQHRDEMTSSEIMYLAFALSRACEHRELYDDAFEFLAKGNSLKAETSPYDDDYARSFMDSIVENARGPISRISADSGCRDSRPVFVLGMPRSGTSLTEQILASHSAVVGAGELSYAYDAMRKAKTLTGEVFPDSVGSLTNAHLKELGEYYMSCHSDDYLDYKYVVDKTPLNFQYIGLLSAMLPKAKFIHCHRAPISNCFSIHKLPFDKKQTYAHNLVSLAKYYNHYWQLMQRWHELLPGRILDVAYEDTVGNVEKQSERLLVFLDLNFEDSVLEFHKTKRLVKTPSASQVREPIYKDAVELWRKYEKHLAPLIDNLDVQRNA